MNIPFPVSWRLRPLRGITQSFCCLVAGGLVGMGLASLKEAKTEADRLAAQWPRGYTTLQCTAELSWAEYGRITASLPAGSWIASKTEGDVSWVAGTLDESFVDSEGGQLLPHELNEGQPVALSRTAQRTLRLQDRLYHVVGTATGFFNSPHVLPLRASPFPTATPDQLRIHLPFENVAALLASYQGHPALNWVNHETQRAAALQGLQTLRRRFLLGTLIAASLASLVLTSLWQSEMDDRKVEIALRRVVGATPGHLYRELLRDGFWTCGFPLWMGLAAFIQQAGVLNILSASAAGLGLLTLLCTLPARRAAYTPPAETLQHVS